MKSLPSSFYPGNLFGEGIVKRFLGFNQKLGTNNPCYLRTNYHIYNMFNKSFSCMDRKLLELEPRD